MAMIFKVDHGNQVFTACDRLFETSMIKQKVGIACPKCDHTVTLTLHPNELHALPNIDMANLDQQRQLTTFFLKLINRSVLPTHL